MPDFVATSDVTIAPKWSRRRRLLVVEDDPVSQIVFREFLESRGHLVQIASSGLAALAFLQVGHWFDLVLTDLLLPDINGIELSRLIREGHAGERNRRIPIVAVTACAFDSDKAACFAAGMNGYLSKPVSLGKLDEVVHRWALKNKSASLRCRESTGGP